MVARCSDRLADSVLMLKPLSLCVLMVARCSDRLADSVLVWKPLALCVLVARCSDRLAESGSAEHPDETGPRPEPPG